MSFTAEQQAILDELKRKRESGEGPVSQEQQAILEDVRQRRTERQEAEKAEGSDFWRGVKGGVNSLHGTAYGLAGLAGAALEDTIGIGEGVRDWGFQGYQEQMGQVNDEYRRAYTWDGATENGDNFVDAVQYYAGRALPDAIGALASGGIGAAIAKKAVTEGVEAVIKDQAKDLLGDKIGDKITAEGLGATAGVFTQSVGQSTGGIYGQAGERAIAEGGTLDDVDKSRVALGGLAAGSIETVADLATLGLGRLGPAKDLIEFAGKGGRIRQGVTRGGTGAAVESVTEGVQTGIEDLGAGASLGEANFMDPTSMFAGAVGGGTISGGGGLLTKPNPTASDVQESERQVQEESIRVAEEEALAQAEIAEQEAALSEVKSQRLAGSKTFVSETDFAKERTAQRVADAENPETPVGQAFEAWQMDNDIYEVSPSTVKKFLAEEVPVDDAEIAHQEYINALDEHATFKQAEAQRTPEQQAEATATTTGLMAELQAAQTTKDPAAISAVEQKAAEVLAPVEWRAAKIAAQNAPKETATTAEAAPVEAKPKKLSKVEQARALAVEQLGEDFEVNEPSLSQMLGDGKSVYRKRGKDVPTRFEAEVQRVLMERQAEADAEAAPIAANEELGDAQAPEVEATPVEATPVEATPVEATPVEAGATEAQAETPALSGLDAEAEAYAVEKLGNTWRADEPNLAPLLEDQNYPGFQSNVDRIAAERPATTETDVEQTPVEDTKAAAREEIASLAELFKGDLGDIKLSPNERKVFDHVQKNIRNDSIDEVINANGTINARAIGTALDIGGTNTSKYVRRAAEKVAKAKGYTMAEVKKLAKDTINVQEAADVNDGASVLDEAGLAEGGGFSTVRTPGEGSRANMAQEDKDFIDDMEETPIRQQTPEQLAAVRAEHDAEIRQDKAYGEATGAWDNGFEGDVENEADRISFETMDAGTRFEFLMEYNRYLHGDIDLNDLGAIYTDIRALYIKDTEDAKLESADQGRQIESDGNPQETGQDQSEVRSEGTRPEQGEESARDAQDTQQLTAAEQNERASKVKVVTKKKRKIIKQPIPEPKVEARQGDDSQLKSADGVATKLNGEVVYQRGELGLVRGYSAMTGAPVYSAAKGSTFTRVDVESYTGKEFTPEQLTELVEAKQQAELEAQSVHEETPFATYDYQGLAFSANTTPEMQGIVGEWKDMLGIDADVYVTTLADAKADKDKFTGPLRAVGSGTLNPNERGSTRRLADGTHYIIFDEQASKVATLETLAHELGHVHQKEAFDQAPKELQEQVKAEHRKWLESQKGGTAKDLVESLRARKTGKTTDGLDGLSSDQLKSYWTSFSEYYADQVSRWATTQAEPLGAVEKFFSRLANAMQGFYDQLVNQKYLPSDSFVQYLGDVRDANLRDPINDTADQQSDAMQGSPGTQQKPKQSDYRAREGRARDFVKSNFGDGVTQFYDDFNQVIGSGQNGFKFLHDIARDYKDQMPSIGRWYDAVLNSEKARNEIRRQVEGIATLARNMSEQDLSAANDFIGKSTFYQKWGYDPKRPGTTVKTDPVLAVAWGRLNEDQQSLVRGIFEHGENMRLRKVEIAKKAGVDSKFFSAAALEGPYAPLKRFGEYVTELKSQTLLDAEAAYDEKKNVSNKKKLDELKTKSEHYVISFFDTMGQAKKFRDSKAPDFTSAVASEKEADNSAERQMPQDVLEKVLGGLRADSKSGIDRNARDAFEKMVKDMYFKSLDDGNARLSGSQRLNRAGYDENMVRSFLSHARAEASLISSMENGAQINTELANVANEARADRAQLQPIYNLVARHYQDSLTTKDGFFAALQDRLTAANSVYMLTTSIGYHLTNATQPMITAMELRGVFGSSFSADGFGKAMGALVRGYKVSLAATSMDKRMEVGIDLDKVPPQYRKVLEELQLRQLLDVGMEEDLSEFDRFRTGNGMLDAASDKLGTTVHKLYQVARFVEAHNRISTAVASYDLALKNPKAMAVKKMTPEEFAINMVEKTQGNFSRLDAPLVIKGLPKATTQFRKYQLTMAWIYAKGYDAAYRDKSISPEEKAMARRALHAQVMFAGASAGAMGIPLVSSVAPYILAFATGEEEPQDLERWIRANVEDEGMATLLSRGLPAFAGIDMSTKLSQAKIFHPLPYAEWELSPDGIQNTAFQLFAGPLGTTLTNFGRAGQAAERGDVLKAIEYSVPKGLRTAIESYRLGTEGYTMTNGDVAVDPRELSVGALLVNALGIPATEINSIKWTRGQQYELSKYFSEESGRIKREYVKARNGRDTDAQKTLKAEFLDLNKQKDRVRPFFGGSYKELRRQNVGDLMKAVNSQRNRERKTQRRFEGE